MCIYKFHFAHVQWSRTRTNTHTQTHTRIDICKRCVRAGNATLENQLFIIISQMLSVPSVSMNIGSVFAPNENWLDAHCIHVQNWQIHFAHKTQKIISLSRCVHLQSIAVAVLLLCFCCQAVFIFTHKILHITFELCSQRDGIAFAHAKWFSNRFCFHVLNEKCERNEWMSVLYACIECFFFLLLQMENSIQNNNIDEQTTNQIKRIVYNVRSCDDRN